MTGTSLSEYVDLAAQAILANLRLHEQKIYELSQIISEKVLFNWSASPVVAVYQKLFITQAALCEIYFYLEAQGKERLVITPISAWIETRQDVEFGENQNMDNPAAPSNNVQETQEYLSPNIAFFCDETNFYGVTEDTVSALLESFWTRYHDHMEISPSLATLGLPEDVGMEEVRAKYRELASQHHPDKGGDAELFIEIRHAYEVLKRRNG